MKRIHICLIIISSILLLSCTSQKKITYFRNIDAASAKEINKAFHGIHETKICIGDMLSIIISGLDPVTIAPFNLPIVSYANPNSTQLNSSPGIQSYLVDSNGNINFPIIGQIELAGLTKSQAVEKMQQVLSPYLKDVIITIKFLNYKIGVLGEVSHPGYFSINNDRVTILEALAMAGDLTIYGKRDNILIIRDNSGEREFIRINLNSDEIFKSPYYFLQQNDIIYVEPNKTKTVSSLNIPFYLSAITSLASVFCIVYLITNK